MSSFSPSDPSRSYGSISRPGLTSTQPHPLPLRPASPDDAGSVELAEVAGRWLADLRMRGRSARTIQWYQQKVEAYLDVADRATLDAFTADGLRSYIAGLQDRHLAENTVHGCFQVLRSLANWADREGYPVDPALLRLGAPKLPELEVEIYSQEEVDAIVRIASPAWARLAVQTLIGTGLRLSELCSLETDDFEDEAEATFIQVR